MRSIKLKKLTNVLCPECLEGMEWKESNIFECPFCLRQYRVFKNNVLPIETRRKEDI